MLVFNHLTLLAMHVKMVHFRETDTLGASKSEFMSFLWLWGDGVAQLVELRT